MTALGKCIKTIPVLSGNAQTTYSDSDYLPIVSILIPRCNRGISTSMLNLGAPPKFFASTVLLKPRNGFVSQYLHSLYHHILAMFADP